MNVTLSSGATTATSSFTVTFTVGPNEPPAGSPISRKRPEPPKGPGTVVTLRSDEYRSLDGIELLSAPRA